MIIANNLHVNPKCVVKKLKSATNRNQLNAISSRALTLSGTSWKQKCSLVHRFVKKLVLIVVIFFFCFSLVRRCIFVAFFLQHLSKVPHFLFHFFSSQNVMIINRWALAHKVSSRLRFLGSELTISWTCAAYLKTEQSSTWHYRGYKMALSIFISPRKMTQSIYSSVGASIFKNFTFFHFRRDFSSRIFEEIFIKGRCKLQRFIIERKCISKYFQIIIEWASLKNSAM